MLKYDSFQKLATAVVEILEQHGSATPKEIKKYLQQNGWGDPPMNAINKVLTQYLLGQVKLVDNKKWMLVLQDISPAAMDKAKYNQKKSTREKQTVLR